MMPPPDPLLSLFMGLALGYVIGRVGFVVTAVAIILVVTFYPLEEGSAPSRPGAGVQRSP
jgi:hypothetical protein